MFGKPCNSYTFLHPGIRGAGCSRKKVLELERREKAVGRVNMTVYNLCFFCSLQTCHQEEPWSGMIAELPRPEDFCHQHYLWLHCCKERLLCPELSSCPHSCPASQTPDEWSRKTDTGWGHSLTPWPHGRQPDRFPASGHYCPLIFSLLISRNIYHWFSPAS